MNNARRVLGKYGCSDLRSMIASRLKMIVAAVAVMMGSTAAMAGTPHVTLCDSSGFSNAYTMSGTAIGLPSTNGCSAGTTSFVQIGSDNTNSADQISLSNGSVTIQATNGIQMNGAVDMANNTIDGLAAGQLSGNSKQAVNGSQLYATNEQVTNNTNAINALTGAIGLVKQDPTTRNINVGPDTDGTVVDFKGTQGARVLESVANGAVNATSQQAVNGSQLYAVSSSTAQALGGGAAVNPDGTISAPTYTVNGQAVNNVGDAITNLDGRVAQAGAGVTNLTNAINNGTIGLVQQDQTTRTITVAKDTDGTVVDITGTSGARQLTGVAAGSLSATSTDAVNGSQLYATNIQVDALNQRVQNISIGGNSVVASQANDTPATATGANSTAIGNGAQSTAANSVALGDHSVASQDNTVSVGSAGNERRVTNVAAGVAGTDAANMNQLNAVQNNVNTVAREAFSGVAAAMAMPNLTPMQPGRTVVAAGVANYRGYTAIGLGGTYRSEDSHWLVNAAASVTPHGDAGVRGQVGYEF